MKYLFTVTNLNLDTIRIKQTYGKPVSVSELSRNTGLSKGFFYKNEQVRNLLNEEKEKQDQGTLALLKREVQDKSLEIYQREVKRLLNENENLKKENRKLVRTLINKGKSALIQILLP